MAHTVIGSSIVIDGDISGEEDLVVQGRVKGRIALKESLVGPSIRISGKLRGDENLTVRGRVEGELTLSRTLVVEPSGVVEAHVAVKSAVVSGVVVGNIHASESVELTREGRMVGDIRAPRVLI